MPTVERWTGKEARLLREARMMTLREFAEHLGIGSTTVTDWERLGSRARLRQSSQRRLADDLVRAPNDVKDRFELAAARDGSPPSQLDPSNAWTANFVSDRLARPLRPIGGSGPDDPDAATMRVLRETDRRIGGGYLYTAVTGYLQRAIAPRLFGELDGQLGQNPFPAAAALTEMAGWMAHDTGQHPLASQHFNRHSPWQTLVRSTS